MWASPVGISFRRAIHSAVTRQRLIESIVRVDHAGELAADRIYAGQLAVLGKSHKLSPIIQKMWDEEREHLDTMEVRVFHRKGLYSTVGKVGVTLHK
ncbi:ubiquinone biosynthesis protein COQ7 domain-containing protein [Ditylenchus destructor]|uniref:Ubiquinone biosynthesis protein COQ7 domain-containing protein n=1 Tax=Ditylenchus destructor TaxID=166010 RepID=A0AAD4N062_9BILA|nr:ubiquinone biosynthesis protein COQ7 domain-containing protein [Ditylenchus destructor]